VGLTSEN